MRVPHVAWSLLASLLAGTDLLSIRWVFACFFFGALPLSVPFLSRPATFSKRYILVSLITVNERTIDGEQKLVVSCFSPQGVCVYVNVLFDIFRAWLLWFSGIVDDVDRTQLQSWVFWKHQG